jgi:hypothetical protein
MEMLFEGTTSAAASPRTMKRVGFVLHTLIGRCKAVHITEKGLTLTSHTFVKVQISNEAYRSNLPTYRKVGWIRCRQTHPSQVRAQKAYVQQRLEADCANGCTITHSDVSYLYKANLQIQLKTKPRKKRPRI